MPRPTQTAELLPAFFWICDACGRDNFVRCVSASVADMPGLTDEDRVAALDWLAESGCGADALMAPEDVTCDVCGATYETTVAVFDDEGDEDDDA